MRLDKIKLAGFKSFVDPTKIKFPSNLVSLLGPNGCGKSNVIDAVRWVMGESSAKNLRGESLTDVIFNGSVSRKPVAQAMVELIFDNSDNKLQGEHTAFNEVSVKRVLNRDGQSTYFLNKSRCRRKDITDLFLGTGLGPRSYSIIEQGMISRLIEAKPEDVRVYIEEAAGISKYKERRRETENRIRHTRENLERLDDIRHELETQLNRLQRQARTAKRYTELKQQERLKKAQLHALRWREIESKSKTQAELIDKQEDDLEDKVITGHAFIAKIEQARENQTDANESFNQVQGQYYKLESSISRLEQTITHQKERKAQQEQELKQAEYGYQQTQQHAQHDETKYQLLLNEIQQIEPQLTLAQDQAQESEYSLQVSEEKVSMWQSQWNDLTQQMQEPSQTAQVERAKLTQYEQNIVQLNRRHHKLKDELAELSLTEAEQIVAILMEEVIQLESLLSQQQEKLDDNKLNLEQAHQSYTEATHALHDMKHQKQVVVGKKASLEQLQEVALNQDIGSSANWITSQQLQQHQHLLEQIEVDNAYEEIIEIVLGDYLQGLCVNKNEYDVVLGNLITQEAIDFPLCLFMNDESASISSTNQEQVNVIDLPCLNDFVAGPVNLSPLLSSLFVAENIMKAKKSQHQLQSAQVIITRDGYYVGQNWLRKIQSDQQNLGVISRDKLLKELSEGLLSLSEEIANQEELIRLKRQQEKEFQEIGQQAAKQVKQQQRELDQKRNILHSKELYIEQTSTRVNRIQEELDDLLEQVKTAKLNEQESSQKLQVALQQLDHQAEEKTVLSEQKESLTQQLDDIKRISRTDKDQSHQLEIKLNRLQSDFKAMQQNVERLTQQLQRQKHRYEQLKANLEESDDPIEPLVAELDLQLASKSKKTDALTQTRLEVETVEILIRDLDSQRLQNEHTLNGLREQLEQSRLHYQELLVKKENQQEQIDASDFTMEELFLQIPDMAKESEWVTNIDDLTRKIKNLGNINLAAISEYDEQNERKKFLDEQNQDLLDALKTLEGAIAKIDKETRSRFKETFEQVNSKLKELFPRLFGGGRAYLDLTGDDLLDTGVTIMAQPPGKRNNTIHLLSGGEKAMTAVALVFAIFSLNPSPFCMLDEVDAPLDEANVGRFCSMVKEMSETIQFIFITHNKTSMEISDYLCGVTMKEPGVSRIVDVNLQEAVELID